jgi:predicted nucleotidyltransferase
MREMDAILPRIPDELPAIRQRWPVASLALFGSVVREEARPDSDLDILVRFDGPVTLLEFLALEDELAGLAGRRVDLVSAAALKPYIGEIVRRETVRIE